MTTKADFFVPSNAQTQDTEEHLSPSGKYRLVVTPFKTRDGGWNYTQGLVYPIDSVEPIAEIQRNYSSFKFLWIENHPNGNDYLVGGENYQGQTVIELNSGKRIDYLPEAATKGHGFCWVEMKFDQVSKLLIANGCIWACPYEYRFYDFSNPMEMFELKLGKRINGSGNKFPDIKGNEIFCYQVEDYDEDDDIKESNIEAIITLTREGNKLIKTNEWLSEVEKKRRADREAANLAYTKWKEEFISTDPLYLIQVELMKNPLLSPEKYYSYGITYDNWCPDFKLTETRWCQRIVTATTSIIGLEWAVLTGPVKIVIYSKPEICKFFEHSVEGMTQAFEYAISFLKEKGQNV